MKRTSTCCFNKAGFKKGIDRVGVSGLSIPFLFGFFALLFTLGCGPSVDRQLIGDMEKARTEAEPRLSKYDTIQARYNSLVQSISVVPQNLREGSNGQVDQIAGMVGEYKEKVGAMAATYRAQVARIQQIEQAHQAGKLDGEKARAEFEPLRISLELMEQELKPFENDFESIRQEYKRVIEAQITGGKGDK